MSIEDQNNFAGETFNLGLSEKIFELKFLKKLRLKKKDNCAPKQAPIKTIKLPKKVPYRKTKKELANST